MNASDHATRTSSQTSPKVKQYSWSIGRHDVNDVKVWLNRDMAVELARVTIDMGLPRHKTNKY